MRDERQPNEQPVAELAAGRLAIAGGGVLPVALSENWDAPLPHVSGALVVLHGRLRNAPDYLRAGLDAIGTRPGWLVAAPQFLAGVDVGAFGVPRDVLRWTLTGWMGGDAATGPVPLSAFAALDAVVARLRRIPGLRRIVVAGHSGGGQVVQRYAMLGDTAPDLRFLVMNPSSYAFPDAWRPEPVAGCPEYDDWKYGLRRLPSYAGTMGREALVRRYAGRDITYLLGARDTDPLHPALDISAAARCQGVHRRTRGEAFHAALLRCAPSCRHPLHVVPGVGHDGAGMLTSAAGQAALFG